VEDDGVLGMKHGSAERASHKLKELKELPEAEVGEGASHKLKELPIS
jgi:hypothetical protein